MATDDRVIHGLRATPKPLTAVALAERLDELTKGGLSQAVMVMYFKQAFPQIPLRVLLDAGAWHRVSHGAMSDEQFNARLAPWLKE